MTTILKRENLLPIWTGNLLDTGNFFGTRLFDASEFDFDKKIPSVNITENEKEFRIEMAVPGLKREDFKVELENGILCISSEKEAKSSEEKNYYTRREYSYNSFRRSFTLPHNSLADKINAKYEDGVLYVTLPKKEVTVRQPVKEIKVS